jgi:Uncharacterised protein family (UPF0014)
MVGMIIAGADPLEAVRLQIVVLYMLLGSVSIAAILVGTLSYRSFFTSSYQLRKSVCRVGPGPTAGYSYSSGHYLSYVKN